MDLECIKYFIANAPHRPWCEQADGNIYSCGAPCNCGKEAALDTFDRLQDILSRIRLEPPSE